MGPLGILLPGRCAGCGLPGQAVCERCLAGLVRLRAPFCERCGAPGPWPVARCVECVGRRLGFVRARAAVVYDGIARRLVAAWKERGRRDLAAALAAVVVETVARPAVEALTWVPGDRERGLARGHVPAEGLARALAEAWELPAAPLLRRTGRSERQVGRRLAERRRNVRGAFASARPPPRRVCVVDDVYTSGSTVSTCASVLRRAGARHVEAVCLARAVR